MDYLRRRFGRDADVISTTEDEISPLELQDSEDEGNSVNEEFDVIQEFVPIRFLENRIRTLSRTSVPHDLKRLEQHRENMTRLHAEEAWDRLHAEQLNASRTVQQLKGHLQTLDELRQQVRADDLATFDQFTDALRESIHAAVQDYQAVTATMGPKMGGEGEWAVATGEGSKEEGEGEGVRDEGADGQTLQRAHKVADHYQSLEDLRAELVELNGLVHQLNTAANEHSIKVARLRQTTESAGLRVHEGVGDIRGGQRLKAYVLPVGGAIVGGVLGGVVGGPVGAFAGFKVGALTATAVGTAGAVGGALIGFRVRKADKKESTESANAEGSAESANGNESAEPASIEDSIDTTCMQDTKKDK